MDEDMDALGHIFGLLSVRYDLFPVLGAVGFVLLSVYQVRRWWDV